MPNELQSITHVDRIAGVEEGFLECQDRRDRLAFSEPDDPTVAPHGGLIDEDEPGMSARFFGDISKFIVGAFTGMNTGMIEKTGREGAFQSFRVDVLEALRAASPDPNDVRTMDPRPFAGPMGAFSEQELGDPEERKKFTAKIDVSKAVEKVRQEAAETEAEFNPETVTEAMLADVVQAAYGLAPLAIAASRAPLPSLMKWLFTGAAASVGASVAFDPDVDPALADSLIDLEIAPEDNATLVFFAPVIAAFVDTFARNKDDTHFDAKLKAIGGGLVIDATVGLAIGVAAKASRIAVTGAKKAANAKPRFDEDVMQRQQILGRYLLQTARRVEGDGNMRVRSQELREAADEQARKLIAEDARYTDTLYDPVRPPGDPLADHPAVAQIDISRQTAGAMDILADIKGEPLTNQQIALRTAFESNGAAQ